jgi:hypothetical protein
MTIEQHEPESRQIASSIVEDARRVESTDIVLTRYDVICGRDKKSQGHAGNKRFRVLVEHYRERYQSTLVREEKTRITCEIIERIRSGSHPGGRFLKPADVDGNGWIEAGEEFTREKVSHALRSAKDPNRKKNRKKREPVPKSPCERENRLVAHLLNEQLKVFHRLVAERTGQEFSMRVGSQAQATPMNVCSMFTKADDHHGK